MPSTPATRGLGHLHRVMADGTGYHPEPLPFSTYPKRCRSVPATKECLFRATAGAPIRLGGPEDQGGSSYTTASNMRASCLALCPEGDASQEALGRKRPWHQPQNTDGLFWQPHRQRRYPASPGSGNLGKPSWRPLGRHMPPQQVRGDRHRVGRQHTTAPALHSHLLATPSHPTAVRFRAAANPPWRRRARRSRSHGRIATRG